MDRDKTWYNIRESKKLAIKRRVDNLLPSFEYSKEEVDEKLREIKEVKDNHVKKQEWEEAAKARDIERELLAAESILTTEESVQGLIDLFMDAIMAQYGSPNMTKILTRIREAFEDTPKKLPKDQTKLEKKQFRLRNLVKRMADLVPYRFFYLDAGGVSRSVTLYSTSHEGAWKQVMEYVINERKGHVRAVLGLTVGEKDIGTLWNLGKMFEPIEDDGKVRSVRASDLLPEWEDYGK